MEQLNALRKDLERIDLLLSKDEKICNKEQEIAGHLFDAHRAVIEALCILKGKKKEN